MAFDLPREVWAAVLLTDDVVTVGVDVFGVEEETIHIEETGADFGKSEAQKSA